jgi:hypothetical protein
MIVPLESTWSLAEALAQFPTERRRVVHREENWRLRHASDGGNHAAAI